MAKLIDRAALTALILKHDAEKKYSNRTALYKAVSSDYHSAHSISFSPAFVGVKVKEWNIELVTPMGVRVGAKSGGPVVRKAKGNKSLAILRKIMEKDADAKRFLPVLAKVEKGSLKQRMRLNCLYCSNWQPKEIKFCQCFDCPFHDVRPYQQANVGVIE